MDSRIKDLKGKRFGRLTVIEHSHSKNGLYWLCGCDCGRFKIVHGGHLRRKSAHRTISCGCYRKRPRKHGFTAWKSPSRIYRIWSNMIKRCKDLTDKNYGARGISVCERWTIAKNFFDDMWDSYEQHCDDFGIKQTQIDRIDVNGHYEPSNCRWVTCKEQRANQRPRKNI